MRYKIFRIIVFTLTIICTLTVSAEKKVPPNFIIIIADDMSISDMSCYGNKGIKTPNLQKLADSGIKFTNTYLTAANCSPSRASIITGRWPVSNGQTDLATGALVNYKLQWPKFFDKIDFFPKLLKDAGYYTAQSGKWHIGFHWLKASGPAKGGFDHTDAKGGASGGDNWLKVLDNRPKDKPFFMWFAAHDPHDPWKAPKVHSLEDVTVPPFIPDTKRMRSDLAKYYDEIHRLDKHVGRVIHTLKEQGVYENTVVIFMADNGRGFWRSKSYIYDAGMQTPFLLSWPEKIKISQTADHLISAIDLAPTLIELAGLKPDDYTFQGRSILPILLNTKSANVNKYIISEQNWHGYANHYRSVRDKDGFLYVWNGNPDRSGVGSKNYVDYMVKLNNQGQLTDLQKDPLVFPRNENELYQYKKDIHQQNNLINSPEYNEKIVELREVLKKWKLLTGDKMAEKEIPDWYQRPYIREKPQKGIWGDAPGTRNFGIGNEKEVKELTLLKETK